MNNQLSPHANLAEEAIEQLKQRASQLAQGSSEDTNSGSVTGDTKDLYLSFQVLQDRYGVPINSVGQVIALRTIIPVPGSPGHLAGLTRHGPRMLALVDVRRFWNAQVEGHADSDLAVVVQHEGVECGLLCSKVEGILLAPTDQITTASPNLPMRLAACLVGLADRDVMLLSPRRLFGQPQFVVRQQD